MVEEDTSEPDVGALDTVTPSLASPESDTRQMDRLRAATDSVWGR